MSSEHVVHVHAGMQRRQTQKCAAEHSRRHQQHDGKRHFCDHIGALQPTRRSCEAARASAKRAFDVVHADAQRRGEAEQHAARDRDGQREEPDGCVDSDFTGARQAPGPHRHERAHAGRRDQRAECSASYAEDSAFRQALADQATPARTECGAHRELPFARGGASEQQARDVHARNEQHQADGGEEQPQR